MQRHLFPLVVVLLWCWNAGAAPGMRTQSHRPTCEKGQKVGYERHPGMGLTAHFCLEDARRHGPYWIDRLGGGLRLLQRYEKGRLSGPMSAWHSNGKRATEGHFVDGLAHGVWIRWNERGNEIARFVMRHGNGTWVEAWDNGALRSKGPLVRGERHGTWVHWRPHGKLRTLGAYVRGDRHGVWQFFNRAGKPNGTNVYDRGTGLEVRWHDNGVMRSRGWVKRGRRQGDWVWWHDNGQRALQSRYEDNLVHGITVGWHRNGTKASEQSFDRGFEHGLERRWTMTGALLVERNWRTGQPHGKALYFDHMGTLRAATCFADGRIMSHRSDLEFAPTRAARSRLKRGGKVQRQTTVKMIQAARSMACGTPNATRNVVRSEESIK